MLNTLLTNDGVILIVVFKLVDTSYSCQMCKIKMCLSVL